MKKEKTIYVLILLIGICILSVDLYVNAYQQEQNAKEKINITKVEEINLKDMAASASMVLTEKQEKPSKEKTLLTEVEMEVAPASVKKTPMEVYDEMSVADREAALHAGKLHMEYSGYYTYSDERLSLSKGAQYYNGHKETYYSEKVLPGTSLNIPGRHVADDGTVRDGDGFICVAADPGYMGIGSILMTSLGPAKVYDTGCAYGTIDIYVSW